MIKFYRFILNLTNKFSQMHLSVNKGVFTKCFIVKYLSFKNLTSTE